MYQKAAIISMMSEEEVKKTGEDIVELFRSVSLIKELTMSSLNKMGLREIYHGNIQCRVFLKSEGKEFGLELHLV